MPMPSYSPAAADLGLGDQLKSQLETEEELRKKKLLKQAQAMAQPMSPAVQTLYAGTGIGGV